MADARFVVVRANEFSQRTTNANIPYSAEELAADAAACEAAGAAMYHFHARDPDSGAPRWDTESYRRAMEALRDATQMAIMPTLGASTVPDPADRLTHIVELCKDPRTRPDLVPIDMGSFNVDPYDPTTKTFRTEDITYVTPVRALRELVARCTDLGVRAVPVAWNIGSVRLIEAFLDMDLLESPTYVELTLSDLLLTTHPPTEAGLRAYVDIFPAADLHWTALHYGGDIGLLAGTIGQLGGGIAIGLGDHPHDDHETNADLVTRSVDQLRSGGHNVGTAADFRAAFDLEQA